MQQRRFNNLALAFADGQYSTIKQRNVKQFSLQPKETSLNYFSTTMIMSRTRDFGESKTINLKPSV